MRECCSIVYSAILVFFVNVLYLFSYSEVIRKSFVTAVIAYLKTNHGDVFHDELFTDRAKGVYSLGKFDIPAVSCPTGC